MRRSKLRRDRLYLLDIVHACSKLALYTLNRTFDQFTSDAMFFDAVVHNLQIIGEAARALTSDTRDLAPEIEWTRIVGLRHIIVHHYFGIDEEIVWDLATNQAPKLLFAADDMLHRLPDDGEQ